MHNSHKKAAVNTLSKTEHIINNIKYDIGASAGKTDNFQTACKSTGLPERLPINYCISRYLSRYLSVKDVNERFSAFTYYYENVKVPKKRETSSEL